MIRALCRWFCGVRTGHYFVQQVDHAQRRLYLSCLHCGAEFKERGVQVTGEPRRRFDGDAQRHRIGRIS